MTVADLLNKYLKALFDVNDSIYKSFISDKDGVQESTIADPIDFNLGAIANVLEWNRQLTKSLLKQIRLDLAEGRFLNLIAHDHIGIVRYDGETDLEYKTRIQNFIIAHKVSPASIIFYTRPFSSPGEPVIIEGQQDSAFADVSFSDNYTSFQNQTPGDEFLHWIFPAIATSSGASAYFFILILQNTASEDIPKVIDLVNRWIASGIDYEIHIESV